MLYMQIFNQIPLRYTLTFSLEDSGKENKTVDFAFLCDLADYKLFIEAHVNQSFFCFFMDCI